jgi:hypothetical protein
MLSLGGAFVNVRGTALTQIILASLRSNAHKEGIPTCLQTPEPPTCRGTETATEPFNSRRNPLQ